MNRRRRRAWMLAAFLGPPGIYLALALVLGLVPVNRGGAQAGAGDAIAIYVRTNGVHADIVVPTRALDVDFSAAFPPGHTRGLSAPLPWIAFGWGDHDFMANTPTWRDLSARTAARALFGLGRGAVHVEYLERPEDYTSARIALSQARYRRLVDYLYASVVHDAAGRPVRVAGAFNERDAFYASTTRWTIVQTCNEWVRRGLVRAGVRTAAWAPFEAALRWHLPAHAADYSLGGT
ncbi:MAG TPA: TIGR02117 family protein [Burkholderiaceae bacterium]|nr:TIGR02117 family protein [Burkholderiaceae bacterium]